MRSDAFGFIWHDVPKKVAEKREPPEPVWLRDDYLPGLEEAKRFDIPMYRTLDEIVQACENKERMLFDIEVYPNYFLAAFRSVVTGKLRTFEMTPSSPLECGQLKAFLEAFTTVGFNSANFDLPITALALAGFSNAKLHEAVNAIIVEGLRWRDVLKRYRVKKLEVDHIDLIEVAKGDGSLKLYGGRVHVPKMQDLPFKPGTHLSDDQIAITKWYCCNSDLVATGFLHATLQEQLALRAEMSLDYGIDLRSKSDAQIAEAVLCHEVEKSSGGRPAAPVIAPGTRYKYSIPKFIKYQTEYLNWMLGIVRDADFVVAEKGSIEMPKEVDAIHLEINGTKYHMGIGGLHSCEEIVRHLEDDAVVLYDWDVRSYYPEIILNLGLFPKHLGPAFLKAYRRVVDRRLAAKDAKKKATADSLKIVVNGSFGKLGSKWSKLYSPDLLIQVTLTGQLALLMLIERLELFGIHVVSGNTDGIVVKCPRSFQDAMRAIVHQWEADTGFTMEDSHYKAIYSRDVNNYMAVKHDGKVKKKGFCANPWADPKEKAERLEKNPANKICIEAIEAYLSNGTPVATTILECRDIRKFVTVRAVTGGAVKDGIYLGKAIRWYYAEGAEGEIVYAKNGNKVARSEGAKPCMELPKQFPSDVNLEWYIEEAKSLMKDLAII